MREITVAVVQSNPRLNEVGENITHMSELVEKICVNQKVDLIVFPELATSGYECGIRFTDLAERVPGPSVNLLAQQADAFGTHIVFGMPFKERVESIIYDAVIMVGPDGEIMGDYRKVHLHGEERLAFRAGYRYSVIEANFGSVGLMIGWDMAFPEAPRSLALEGAEIICVCSSWEQPYLEEWNAFMLARAFENAVFIAAANRVGEEPTYSFFGHSMVMGPRGEVYATIDEPIEGYAIAKIDLDDVRRHREDSQLFQLRQPQTYRAVVRKY